VTGGVVDKSLSSPTSTQTDIVPGLGGAAQENSAHRGGIQVIDDNAATQRAPARGFQDPDAQERNEQLATRAGTAPRHGCF
jgi:hypothetical protein